jgi:ferritin-like metal-binding protein YciE
MTREMEGAEKEPMADLALIAAAQCVEHYEISAYGAAKCLARKLGAVDVARILSHTLGEEKSPDFLLMAIADPILQQVALDDKGWGSGFGNRRRGFVRESSGTRRKTAKRG